MLCFGSASALTAAPIITEFMAANKKTLADEDGAFSDWIEIYNPDSVAVEMAGWRLTDNSTNPAKWVFPPMLLEPGGFRIVFASGKNRTNAAGELHTNFSLSAGGEYLSLNAPDGTPSTEFAPVFPPQEDDVSFGSQFSSTTLLAAGHSTRYLVPVSATPALATWTATGFVDTSWTSAPTGLGFGLMVPGMLVKEVQTTAGLGNLAGLDAALAATPTPPSLVANTQIRPYVNMLGEGGDGHYGLNQTFALPGDGHGLQGHGFCQHPDGGGLHVRGELG